MKIVIWNADSFVGSNFANYFLQSTKHDLVLFAGSSVGDRLAHLAGPLSSRSRVSLQIVGNDQSSDARLHIEQPDVVVCVDEFPTFLEGRYRTVYIGKNPTVIGPDRTFLYGNAFGPRQPRSQGIAAALLANKVPANLGSAVYVKDLFDQFTVFLEKADRFAVATEQPICEEDIKAAMMGDSSTKIKNALIHTYAWYQGNAWYQID